MQTRAKLRGVVVAIVIPFTEDEKLVTEQQRTQIRQALSNLGLLNT